MKRFAMFAALAALAVAVPAKAAGERFTVINKTGYDIAEVYIAPSSQDDWEDNILGEDILADGSRTSLIFSRKENVCSWDMRVVYTDGDKAAWRALDLCKISSVELHYNHETGKSSVIKR